MKNFNVYIDFGSSKIRTVAFNKIEQNKFYFTENKCLSNFKINQLNLLQSENIIKKTILEIEKKTGEYLNDINLMIDSPESLLVNVSRSKNIVRNQLWYQGLVNIVRNQLWYQGLVNMGFSFAA